MVEANPERIVSLSPSNTEILFAVGAGDKVVGVTDYCNYPAELNARLETKETVKVGGYWNPSLNTIADLKPDLVLVSTAECTIKTNNCQLNCSRSCELTKQAAHKLESLGLKVLMLTPHSLDDVLDNILMVGNATANSAQANTLVENLKQRIEAVVSKSKTVSERPRVYFEVWNNPYISVNSKTWIGNLISLACGINVFADSVSEWPMVGSEDVVQKDPEVMVFPVIPDVPRFWGSFEEVKKRQGWNQISAVQEGRLFEVLRDCISRPGPRLVETLELLEKLFYTSS
jgi:iron complex transport system substrate-binding protein